MGYKLLIFVIILSFANLRAMESKNEDTLFTLAELPEDIKFELTKILTQSNTQEEASQSIRSLSKVNKDFNRFINDEAVTNTLITLLAHKFAKDNRIESAFNLGTTAARKWFSTKKAKDWFKEFEKNNNWPNELLKDLFKKYAQNPLSVSREKIFALLEIGVNPNITTDIELSYTPGISINDVKQPVVTIPLEIALDKNDRDLLTKLFSAGADPNVNTTNPDMLLVTSIEEDYDTIKLLLQAGKAVSPRLIETLEIILADSRDYEKAQKIIELLKQYNKPENK